EATEERDQCTDAEIEPRLNGMELNRESVTDTCLRNEERTCLRIQISLQIGFARKLSRTGEATGKRVERGGCQFPRGLYFCDRFDPTEREGQSTRVCVEVDFVLNSASTHADAPSRLG